MFSRNGHYGNCWYDFWTSSDARENCRSGTERCPNIWSRVRCLRKSGDLFSGQMLIVILTFLFVAFFDTAGTLVAVAQQAGLMKDNVLPRAGKGLLADSLSIVSGAILRNIYDNILC